MPESMREAIGHVKEIWDNGGIQLPFMAIVAGRPQMNWARIFETLLIAAIVGLMTNYISVERLSMGFQDIKEDMVKIEQKVDKLYSDIYRPVITAIPAPTGE